MKNKFMKQSFYIKKKRLLLLEKMIQDESFPITFFDGISEKGFIEVETDSYSGKIKICMKTIYIDSDLELNLFRTIDLLSRKKYCYID